MPIECLTSFENNPEGVYYAGQEICGSVDLIIGTTKKIRAIHITVKGFAKIRWIKKGYYNQTSERGTCRAYRSYLDSRSYVLGYNGCGCVDLQAGQYSYTFNVILPPNIPTSFDGIYGQIHYEIITAIDRPGRCTKQYRLPFTVIQLINLNDDPIYSVPLEICNQERYWSFCCPTGPITVKFSTPYNGYAPGQKISFILFVDNETGIDVTQCLISFCQEVQYESREPQHEYRYDKHQIVSKIFGNVLRWCRKIYRGSFHIPSIPPSCSVNECPITIQYYIKIKIIPRKFHKKFKMKIPITIGTVPLLDSSPHITRIVRITSTDEPNPLDRTNINNNNNNNNQDNDDDDDEDYPPEYIPMVPPSYQDAMALSQKFVDDNEDFEEINDKKNSMFVPRYPVYKPQNDENSVSDSQTEENY